MKRKTIRNIVVYLSALIMFAALIAGFYLYGEYAEQQQPLSTREMEVLELVTTGLSNKEIAATLGISHQTVKNHVTAILRKLCVEDRTQAALYALRRGWVRLYK